MTDLSGKNFGQYRICHRLGRGGTGEVYVIEHSILHRRYAIKILPEDFGGNPEAVSRFETEVRQMANLDHKNIVRVDDFGKTEGRYWLRMELVKGIIIADNNLQNKENRCITLAQYVVARGGRIEQKEFSQILRQILEALAYAHKKGVVHRNFKPHNVLLEKDVQSDLVVKVADFGLARVIGEDSIRTQAKQSHTQSLGEAATVEHHLSLGEEQTLIDDVKMSNWALVNTWEYMSPEQRYGYEADTRSDVYSVGMMCYRLLSGQTVSMKMPSQAAEGIDPIWDDFIGKALEPEPSSRYADGTEMLKAFEEVQKKLTSEENISENEIVSKPALKPSKFQIYLLAGLVALAVLSFGIWQTKFKNYTPDKSAAVQHKKTPVAIGTLTVKTLPSGACVTLNNNRSQISPATFKGINTGKYQLEISLDGYETVNKEVEIKENETTDLGTVILVRQTGKVRIESDPSGAIVKQKDKNLGITPLELSNEPVGVVEYNLLMKGFYPATVRGKVEKSKTLQLMASLKKAPYPSLENRWTNSLGMVFAPVPGIKVLFSIWETRVKDFKRFVDDNLNNDGYNYRNGEPPYLLSSNWWQKQNNFTFGWHNPGFEQTMDHPVVCVSWHDANAFCQWLTKIERKKGLIGENQFYRLPADWEWSAAVGLNEDSSGTPETKNEIISGVYPWGTNWPPPRKSGNYAGAEAIGTNWPLQLEFVADNDGYARTAPVGSFEPNKYGLFDIGGNVWEWCLDLYNDKQESRVVRGASWADANQNTLLSSHRFRHTPNRRFDFCGFRCVLEEGQVQQ